MKKIISIALLLSLVLGLFACGGEAKDAESSGDTEPGQTENIVDSTDTDEQKDTDVISDTEKTEEIKEPKKMNAVIEKVKGGRDAIVVISHDDGSRPTATYLANEFERLDLRGTISLIASRVYNPETGERKEADIEFWQGILDTGRFNISSHTMTHKFWGMTDEDERGTYSDYSGNTYDYEFEAGKITNETKGSRDILREIFPSQRILTFVKAGFGIHSSGVSLSDKSMEIIAQYYIGTRWDGGGLETIPSADPYKFKSFMARAGEDETKWIPLVDQAIEKKGAIVFLFHGIVEGTASGISVEQEDTTKLFEYVAEKVDEGKVWCAYFEDAVIYTEEVRHGNVYSSILDDQITVKVTDDLDNEIYNLPLTVKCQVPDDWRTVEVTMPDGTVEKLETFPGIAAGTFVHIDVVPDSGDVVLREG